MFLHRHLNALWPSGGPIYHENNDGKASNYSEKVDNSLAKHEKTANERGKREFSAMTFRYMENLDQGDNKFSR